MYENIQEGQYLIKLLSSAINRLPLKSPEDDLDWETLYQLASFHNVANTAYYGLLDSPAASNMPENVCSLFASDARRFSALESMQNYEVRKMLLGYEQSGIFCMPLIGFRMKALYPRPDMRYEATMEFLIHTEDKSKAHQVMTALGYSAIRFTGRSISYFKAPNMSIELMTSLICEDCKYEDFFRGILKKNLHPIKGFQNIYAMSKEDFYIYLIAYLARQYASGGSGIRSILDVWVYLKRYRPLLNYEYLTTEFTKLNLGLFSFYIEKLSWIWFGIGVNFSNRSLYEEMEQHIFSCGSAEPAETNIFHQPEADQTAASVPKKAPAAVFPKLESMSDRYPILYEMPFLLPIFWLVHLSSLLLMKFRKPNNKH
ncbi:MAG: nucleotidyltransferase family protein [Lachnospiraceae bacterium]|nr:nucleotidyltransferase family protein [Lachnospiraceae bacterium]